MAQRSFKLSDELDARLEAAAKADGRTVSNLIVRTLEQTLAGLRLGDTSSVTSPRGSGSSKERAPAVQPASARAFVREVSDREREDAATVEGTPLPKIAPRRAPR